MQPQAQFALAVTLAAELLWCLFLMVKVTDRKNKLYYFGSRIGGVLIALSAVRAFHYGAHWRVYKFWTVWQFVTMQIPSYSIQRYFHLALGALLLFGAGDVQIFESSSVTNATAGMALAVVGLVWTLGEDFTRFNAQQRFGGAKLHAK